MKSIRDEGATAESRSRPFSVAILTLLIIAAMTFGGLSYFEPHAFMEYNQAQRLIKISIISAFTFLGVLSQQIYEARFSSNRKPVRFQADLIYSAIISPIVMIPIYHSLIASGDYFLMAVSAYQNAFFFKLLFSSFVRKDNDRRHTDESK